MATAKLKSKGRRKSSRKIHTLVNVKGRAVRVGEGGEGQEMICSFDEKEGTWRCTPYRYQIVQKELENAHDNNTNHDGLIAKLRDLGVIVYIVPAEPNLLFLSLQEIVQTESNYDLHDGFEHPNHRERCCLYKDEEGRYYNVVISGGTSGLAGSWKGLLISFSGWEAAAAILVLCRSFACAEMGEDQGLKPAYLSLILGLALNEEISNSWLNASMFVKGTPSIGAYVLESYVSADWPRKLIILILAIAAAANGSHYQKYITLTGVTFACSVLAANLGSRGWKILSLPTLQYSGCGSSLIAFVLAVGLGLIVPYFGFRDVEMGGRVALENMLAGSLFLGVVFVLSDLDFIQKFILVGSEKCNQDFVNVAVGIWYTLSLLASIAFYKRIKIKRHPGDNKDDDGRSDSSNNDSEEESSRNYSGDFLLVEDDTSPVGYIVPNIPNYPIDPCLNWKPYFCCGEAFDIVLGIIMALSVGGFLMLLGFTQIDDEFSQQSPLY